MFDLSNLNPSYLPIILIDPPDVSAELLMNIEFVTEAVDVHREIDNAPPDPVCIKNANSMNQSNIT